MVHTETAWESANKYGEELCGDKVGLLRTEDATILVLSDGLGSGVKANILASLTTKIILTMLGQGADIDDCVETIASTLPVCKERGIAYSTFSILTISHEGQGYLVEFDNPAMILLRRGKTEDITRETRVIFGKKIHESRFQVQPEDYFVLISDGVVHAGVGKLLNLGWQHEHIRSFLTEAWHPEVPVRSLTRTLLSACECLYMDKPGDDATVAMLRIRKRIRGCVMVGPPQDRSRNLQVVKELMSTDGRRIVCGGTTSQIVAEHTGKKLEVTFDYVDKTIPPCGRIEGIDLATEGVLTLRAALELLRSVAVGTVPEARLARQDGATRLVRMMVEDCTDLRFLVGRALNPAHQNPDLPITLSIKLNLVSEIARVLESMGKTVLVEYY